MESEYISSTGLSNLEKDMDLLAAGDIGREGPIMDDNDEGEGGSEEDLDENDGLEDRRNASDLFSGGVQAVWAKRTRQPSKLRGISRPLKRLIQSPQGRRILGAANYHFIKSEYLTCLQFCIEALEISPKLTEVFELLILICLETGNKFLELKFRLHCNWITPIYVTTYHSYDFWMKVGQCALYTGSRTDVLETITKLKRLKSGRSQLGLLEESTILMLAKAHEFKQSKHLFRSLFLKNHSHSLDVCFQYASICEDRFRFDHAITGYLYFLVRCMGANNLQKNLINAFLRCYVLEPRVTPKDLNIEDFFYALERVCDMLLNFSEADDYASSIYNFFAVNILDAAVIYLEELASVLAVDSPEKLGKLKLPLNIGLMYGTSRFRMRDYGVLENNSEYVMRLLAPLLASLKDRDIPVFFDEMEVEEVHEHEEEDLGEENFQEYAVDAMFGESSELHQEAESELPCDFTSQEFAEIEIGISNSDIELDPTAFDDFMPPETDAPDILGDIQNSGFQISNRDEEAIKFEDSLFRQRLRLAEEFIFEGMKTRGEKLVQHLRTYLASSPPLPKYRKAEYWMRIGKIFEVLQLNEDAVYAYVSGLEVDPHDCSLLHLFGRIVIRIESFEALQSQALELVESRFALIFTIYSNSQSISLLSQKSPHPNTSKTDEEEIRSDGDSSSSEEEEDGDEEGNDSDESSGQDSEDFEVAKTSKFELIDSPILISALSESLTTNKPFVEIPPSMTSENNSIGIKFGSDLLNSSHQAYHIAFSICDLENELQALQTWAALSLLTRDFRTYCSIILPIIGSWLYSSSINPTSKKHFHNRRYQLISMSTFKSKTTLENLFSEDCVIPWLEEANETFKNCWDYTTSICNYVVCSLVFPESLLHLLSQEVVVVLELMGHNEVVDFLKRKSSLFIDSPEFDDGDAALAYLVNNSRSECSLHRGEQVIRPKVLDLIDPRTYDRKCTYFVATIRLDSHHKIIPQQREDNNGEVISNAITTASLEALINSTRISIAPAVQRANLEIARNVNSISAINALMTAIAISVESGEFAHQNSIEFALPKARRFLIASDYKNVGLQLIVGFEWSFRRQFSKALKCYLDAFCVDPTQPLVSLTLACFLTFFSFNHLGVMDKERKAVSAIAFYNMYKHLRMEQANIIAKHANRENNAASSLPSYKIAIEQEVHYNLGRIFEFFKSPYLAVEEYKKVLSLADALPELESCELNLTKEAAHNLCLIYQRSGTVDLAFDIMKKYLSL